MRLAERMSTTTYEVGDGFYVDIVETDTEIEAWIFHKSYGIKKLMFGATSNESCIKNLTEADLSIYKSLYKNEYMED